MTRLFGIAGVQMTVVPWDANATVDKMVDITHEHPQKLPLGAADHVPRAGRPGTGPVRHHR